MSDVLFDERRGSLSPPERGEPRLLDRDDLAALERTPGVRRSTRASARLLGTLGGTAKRRDVALARRRIGGYRAPEPAPTVDPADPLGVGRLLPAVGLHGLIVSKPQRRIARR